MERGSSWRLPAVVVGILVCAALFSPPAAALNIGIQSAGDGVSKQQACSRTCESDHCTTPPFLRYGKYCGILYSGCPGEPPCDALDACCMHHDNCVQAKMDYLSTACNEALLDCLARLREGTSTFNGNKCMIDEVIDVISLVIEAAVVAGRVLHKP
ncbi:Phospholipase A2 homolog 3 precursor [Zea mays]|uniref:phospholipase A2 n=1 Tax=Zea mays TaxID=4577 RepID=A0A1D6L1L7_MAIZE|nr:Phospholipase A2 homolog 3 precursor [Zea mays]ONM08422.1 Phospholipase A2 [Zea mays]|eukprot:NP_001339274.1 uncharacterized LOC100216649 precursor [Zea mays]